MENAKNDLTFSRWLNDIIGTPVLDNRALQMFEFFSLLIVLYACLFYSCFFEFFLQFDVKNANQKEKSIKNPLIY